MDLTFYLFILCSDVNDFCLYLCQVDLYQNYKIGVSNSSTLNSRTLSVAPKLYLYECLIWEVLYAIELGFIVLKLIRYVLYIIAI